MVSARGSCRHARRYLPVTVEGVTGRVLRVPLLLLPPPRSAPLWTTLALTATQIVAETPWSASRAVTHRPQRVGRGALLLRAARHHLCSSVGGGESGDDGRAVWLRDGAAGERDGFLAEGKGHR